MSINKSDLLQKIILKLEDELFLIAEAAKNTYEIATHEENKPENEYDTRGIEAAYLAGAQAQRVVEMKETVLLLRALKVKNFSRDDKIAFTALVELESHNKKTFLFLLPKAGGVKVNQDNVNVQVVTPESPLGEALVGLAIGEEVTIDSGQSQKSYEVVSVQ